jgi:hypothetical protein
MGLIIVLVSLGLFFSALRSLVIAANTYDNHAKS